MSFFYAHVFSGGFSLPTMNIIKDEKGKLLQIPTV
jgi:hypothetical protein